MNSEMSAKTYTSALVVLPPRQVWEPIQMLRRRYDRKIRRWPPHITLVYPFLPLRHFEEASSVLRQVLGHCASREVQLTELSYFRHRRSVTLWLKPEPKEFFLELVERLGEAFPEHRHQSRFPQGFTPHLSVGNVPPEELSRAQQWIQAQWRPPLKFYCNRIGWLTRGERPPEDVFFLKGYFYLNPREGS